MGQGLEYCHPASPLRSASHAILGQVDLVVGTGSEDLDVPVDPASLVFSVAPAPLLAEGVRQALGTRQELPDGSPDLMSRTPTYALLGPALDDISPPESEGGMPYCRGWIAIASHLENLCRLRPRVRHLGRGIAHCSEQECGCRSPNERRRPSNATTTKRPHETTSRGS